VFQLEQDIEAFMCFRCYFTLTTFLFILNADGRRREGGLVGLHWLLVHLLDFLHDLISLLLQNFDISGFLLHGILHIFNFATQPLILSQQCHILLFS
jgi:hypothetical protein